MPPEKVNEFLLPQDVGVLRGVGPKTKLVLNKYGIKTVKDLRKLTKEQLKTALGAFGESIYWQGRGEYEEELIEEWTAKSMGRNHTFEHDTKDKEEIFSLLDAMINDTWKQLKSEGFRFKTITIRIRYEDFETHTKQKSLIDYSDSIDAIRNTAKDLFQEFLKDPRKIRLIGVSVSQLQ